MIIHAKKILIGDSVVENKFLTVEDGLIASIQDSGNADQIIEGTLIPGFVDIHSHGGGGFYFSDENVENIRKVISTHKAHGTTSIMASLVSEPIEKIKSQIARLRPLVQRGELLGIHLEGPFLSEHKCGAHDPKLLRDPDLTTLSDLVEFAEGTIAMVTMAPERKGGIEAVEYLVEHGITVAIGHSDGTYESGKAALAAGASVYTHFYNATPKFDIHAPYTEPTIATAALEDPDIAYEIINDGVHLSNEVIQFILKHAPHRVIAITDAMSAAGGVDGAYTIGALGVTVKAGVARLSEGNSLAGSTLTMDRTFNRLISEFGLTIAQASFASSTLPARTVGYSYIGEIREGALAEFVEVRNNAFYQTLIF